MENREKKTFNLGFNITPSNGSQSRSLLVNPAPAGWGFVGERLYLVPHDLRSTDNSFLLVAIGDGEFPVEFASILGTLIAPTGVGDYKPRLLAVHTYYHRVNEPPAYSPAPHLHHLFLGSVGFILTADGNVAMGTTLGFIVLEGHYKRLTFAELARQAQKRKSDPSPDQGTHANVWEA